MGRSILKYIMVSFGPKSIHLHRNYSLEWLKRKKITLDSNITVIPNPTSNFAIISKQGYDKSEKKIIMLTLFGSQIFEAQLDQSQIMHNLI